MSDTDSTDDNLTEHSYDGIQEYDNPLPGWWSWLFFGTFAFSIFYLVYYHLGGSGQSVHEEYDAKAAEIMNLRFAQIGNLEPNRETILAYMNDPEWLVVGRAVFKTNCVSCHGQDAQGIVGPNLTDEYWKNVSHVEDIARVVLDGAGNGAMPAWRNRLSHINQTVLVTAYIASLRGSNPAGGKAPEGQAVAPWNAGEPSP